jgi:DNA helicase-2/ATP-dependent DNA helicase PcrA
VTGFQPRASQREVLAYTGGKMGVSAVPGSGKTHTLAELAAKLVATAIDDDQEVLVVTLVNSAVDNFKRRINESVRRRGLLPSFGYRVRTLHGLAHDIVRERPGLVGLSEDFGILDEREAEGVHEDAVETWLHSHPDAADSYLGDDLEGRQVEWVKRARWPLLVQDFAAAFVKRAKDLQLPPEVLSQRLESLEGSLVGGGLDRPLQLARMGTEIYADYQRSLAYRGMVDFDDLIRLALEALQRDASYLARLQHRWPYVLEDEAQDSSELQEKILRLLAGSTDDSGKTGNWVRVGDPNQAIYETFTTADPDLLRNYLGREQDVIGRELPESGRSQPAIIALANYLIDWVRKEHPTPEVRGALTEPHIEPTQPGDPQPNPRTNLAAVRLVTRDFTPAGELQFVADSVQRWAEHQSALDESERQTCAVLAPRNQRGFELIGLFKHRRIPYVELLRSSTATRETAGALGNLLRCLADPTSARKLSGAFRVWRREDRDDADALARVEAVAKRLLHCPTVEAYLWPRAAHDWLAALRPVLRSAASEAVWPGTGSTAPEGVAPELPEDDLSLLLGFREMACRWHRAAALPIDQLVLTLAGDLFEEPAELALAYKLAVLLRDVAEAHPGYRLPELVEELEVIARNERRFIGFSSEDSGFEPPRGVVTVATMHKAKGLEWDRVYLLSVNNYSFPSGLANDTYVAERWFVRDHLNLEAEALAQLETVAGSESTTLGPLFREEGEATQEARLAYVAERLRLLYVGITRARRELFITWNTGRRQAAKLQAALPFLALYDYRQDKLPEELK